MPDRAAYAQIVLRSDPHAVREGLQSLFRLAPLCHLSADGRGTVEIVLAEALNNIVEHAYGGAEGRIQVRLGHVSPDIWCEIADGGIPMPDETLPAGHLRDIAPSDDLPEGGFGWFLIRTLAHDLTYRRQNGGNLLTFRLQVA